MAVQCPTCAVPMDEMPATPPDGQPVIVDVCPRCGGLWLDADEIGVVVPELEVVKGQAKMLAAAARRGTGIPACPRCFEAPLEIDALGLAVDYCAACGGLWLDGDEHTGFSQESDRQRGLTAPGPSMGGAYRTAAKAAQTGLVGCSACGAETPLAKSYMSSGGVVCPACHAGAMIREKDREVREQVTLGDPGVSMAARFQQPAPQDARDAHFNAVADELRRSPEMSQYVGAVLTVLKALDQGSGCPLCGCGRYSRCGHGGAP